MKEQIAEDLMKAFEDAGCTGHDLGHGLMAMVDAIIAGRVRFVKVIVPEVRTEHVKLEDSITAWANDYGATLRICSAYHYKLEYQGFVINLWPSADKYQHLSLVSTGIKDFLNKLANSVQYPKPKNETPLRSVSTPKIELF